MQCDHKIFFGSLRHEIKKKLKMSTATSPIVTAKKGVLAKEEETRGIIKFQAVANDNSRESMIILTGLKNIFQKQLPKMPREYIARLVYDRKHESMAIVKKDMTVLGGITYRVFPGRKFAEIVFCAVTSTEQVKGYGSYMMDHLKAHVRKTSDAEHFLTYADNYAVGYFKKQGFTADVTLDRSVWAGFIKDYEGGVIMQCTMVPRIDYLKVREIIDMQKKAVHEKIQSLMADMSTAYPGLQVFLKSNTPIDPYQIPGVTESGWNPDMGHQAEEMNPLYPLLRQLLTEIQSQTWSWPFREPVDPEQVPGYYAVIKEPMDLKTMDNRVEAGFYSSVSQFGADFTLMVNNCRKFNDSKSVYVKCANKLDQFFNVRIKTLEEQVY